MTIHSETSPPSYGSDAAQRYQDNPDAEAPLQDEWRSAQASSQRRVRGARAAAALVAILFVALSVVGVRVWTSNQLSLAQQQLDGCHSDLQATKASIDVIIDEHRARLIRREEQCDAHLQHQRDLFQETEDRFSLAKRDYQKRLDQAQSTINHEAAVHKSAIAVLELSLRNTTMQYEDRVRVLNERWDGLNESCAIRFRSNVGKEGGGDHPDKEQWIEQCMDDERGRHSVVSWGISSPGPCAVHGKRQRTAFLVNLPKLGDAVQSCQRTRFTFNGEAFEDAESCEDLGFQGARGTWYVHDKSCATYWDFAIDKGCTGWGSGHRRYSAKLEGLDEADDIYWRSLCSSTANRLRGQDFASPTACKFDTREGLWDTEDWKGCAQ